MEFDRKLAIRIAHTTRDRDRARFFAGRKREIAAFENALGQTSDGPQAVFRVYHGAPGSGKTSLAAHLAETHGDKVLFVPAEPHHLETIRALSRRIAAQATSRTGATRAARVAAQLAAAHFGVEPLGDLADNASMRRAAKAFPIVVHLDEAHETAPRAGDTLRSLHTVGAGVPCVAVLTGLEHTTSRVTAIPGLSRLASDAVVPMGRMATAECVESTLQMLDALRIRGHKDFAARQVADMAFEWPQHLHCAQQELTRELIEHGGCMDRVDWKGIDERTAGRRARYYSARLDHPPLDIDKGIARQILVGIEKGSARTLFDLEDVCRDEIEAAGLYDRYAAHRVDRTPVETHFAKALVEKGLLKQRNGEWSVAIPSMAAWAKGGGRSPGRRPHRAR